MEYDVIILGAGPAGITAAIYCARSNLKVALIDKGLIGGNPLNYLEIENYPGMCKTMTSDLVDKWIEHLGMYDNIITYEFQDIKQIDLEKKLVITEDYELTAKKIIIATGSKPRMLNVPGEEKFIGKGVHYCAICDGPLYKGKQVAVIGGGNSACEEALGLSKICKKVYIIEFTDKLNAEQTTIDKINSTENVQVYTNTSVTEILGDTKVNKIKIHDEYQKTRVIDIDRYAEIDVDGIFVYIGMSPNYPESEPQLACDKYGYIQVNEDMETSIKGVYAIGDITSKKYRQVVTAMNDGAIAAIHISKVL